ncbi:MAG: hypothetical protein AAFN92_04355 [Bacteroidota bacterium]
MATNPKKRNLLKAGFDVLLSERSKERTERTMLAIAIGSYLAHLLLIFLNTQGVFGLEQNFFRDPIAAIYTPFSFILIYEVYLLIYFLPKSITIYIGKQYEIITLIVIRRIFKDIAYVDLESNWFENKYDLQFTYDIVTSLILFGLIFLFYQSVKKRNYRTIDKPTKRGAKMKQFVLLKQSLAALLVPFLIGLALYAVGHWAVTMYADYANGILEFKQINNVFFDQFFTVLIVVDVLLLLFSFFHSDQFHKIIRNSGFVISTILIKVSFLSVGIVNNVLIVSAVFFGYLILLIHNLYERDAEARNQ